MRRALSPNQRLWVISVLLVALVARALIPAGFMPATDRPLSFQICPDGFPAALLQEAAGAAAMPLGAGADDGAPLASEGMLAHTGHHHEGSADRTYAATTGVIADARGLDNAQFLPGDGARSTRGFHGSRGKRPRSAAAGCSSAENAGRLMHVSLPVWHGSGRAGNDQGRRLDGGQLQPCVSSKRSPTAIALPSCGLVPGLLMC